MSQKNNRIHLFFGTSDRSKKYTLCATQISLTRLEIPRLENWFDGYVPEGTM